LERVFQNCCLILLGGLTVRIRKAKIFFQGGFLGLDNIGVFDRSSPTNWWRYPTGRWLSWMAMYCLDMLRISLELAKENSAYEDIASKFFEHFLYITDAMNGIGKSNSSME